ncbi:hypothetical protein LINPERHAP1_LOCUS38977 [Linum perenne]
MRASPIASEARAILEASSYAASSPLNCIILSDCKTLVDSLHGPDRLWPWECFGTLGCISSILKTNSSISLKFINIRFNAQADWVAKHTRMGNLPAHWLGCIPLPSLVRPPQI